MALLGFEGGGNIQSNDQDVWTAKHGGAEDPQNVTSGQYWDDSLGYVALVGWDDYVQVDCTDTSDDTIIVGFRYRVDVDFNVDETPNVIEHALLTIHGTTNPAISVTFDVDKNLVFRRGAHDGTVLYTSSFKLKEVGDTQGSNTLHQWEYLELKVVRHASAGSIELRKEGTVQFTETSLDTLTGQDTDISWVRFQNPSPSVANPDIVFADMVICDSTTSDNNDYLGDVKVVTIRTTGDTATEDWTLSTGTSSWALIDDMATTTNSISSGTTSDKTRCTLDNIPSLGNGEKIAAVEYSVYHDRDTTATSMRTNLHSDTTEDTGDTVVLTEANALTKKMFIEDPDTAAGWTESAVNALEIEFEVV